MTFSAKLWHAETDSCCQQDYFKISNSEDIEKRMQHYSWKKKKVLPYITMLSSFIPPPAMNEAHSVERRKDLQDSYSKSDTINSVYNFNNVAVRTEYIQDKWSYFITHLVGEEALDIRHFCFHNPNHLAVQEVLHCLQPLSLPFSTGSIHNVSLIYPLFHYLAFWKIYTNRKRKK